MSHIPNSAMPHATAKSETNDEQASSKSIRQRAGEIADKARENPKTAIAAGAAVVAGAVAAAAIPLVRARKSAGGEKKAAGGSKKNSQ